MTSSGPASTTIESLVARLRRRQPEIEEAVFRAVSGIPTPAPVHDAEYLIGLRAATTALIDYSLTCLDQGRGWIGSVPSAAISQSRHAAYSGVPLETVLLRYITGAHRLIDYILEEAEAYDIPLRDIRQAQDLLLRQLTATAATEYREAEEQQRQSSDQRRDALIRRLLAGESLIIADLDYSFDAWHLGLIVTGTSAEKTLRTLSRSQGCRLLLILIGKDTYWAWFGSDRRLSSHDVVRFLTRTDGTISAAIGEPARGTNGWRLTYDEAQAAHHVALNNPKPVTRCVDVLLDAAVLRDDVIGRALRATYLQPLDHLRIGARVARETLDVYFSCRHNAAKTAAILGVTRKTVENRLRDIENALGRPLNNHFAEIEVALRVVPLLHTVLHSQSP